MPQPVIETINLGAAEQTYLAGLCDDFASKPPMSEAAAADWVEQRSCEPDALPEGLRLIGRAMTQTPLVLIRGIEPPNDLPATPTIAVAGAEGVRAHRWQIPHLMIASQIGTVFGCDHTRPGRLQHDIFTLPDTEDSHGYSYGHFRGLGFHTDGAMDPPNAPGHFSMHCLRNYEQIPTMFTTFRPDELDDEAKQLLREPAYTIRFDANKPRDNDVRDVTVIDLADDGTLQRLGYYDDPKRLRPDADLPVSDRWRYQKALRRLGAVLARNTIEYSLQAGEIILVDNFAVVHGRRAAERPIADMKTRRWLTRYWITDDPAQMRRVREAGNRILVSDRSPEMSSEPTEPERRLPPTGPNLANLDRLRVFHFLDDDRQGCV